MGKIIYVLEDDQGISDIVEMVLESEGYQVSCFPSVSTFNATAFKPPADLYLLDIMLPDGNGLDVREALSNNSNTAASPVLIMSAHTNRSEVSGWPRAQHFIAKPFDINELTEKIASLLTD
ncbi:response regulator transcription factor [Pedobacter frigidisoli]|uniref:response regulator transcription factor n=1 Tax=Pedobacter frigidisoli TaxID=2530455 RepID=UPI00292E72A3|nr:response regulator [Pedobacter frigidisoli]